MTEDEIRQVRAEYKLDEKGNYPQDRQGQDLCRD